MAQVFGVGEEAVDFSETGFGGGLGGGDHGVLLFKRLAILFEFLRVHDVSIVSTVSMQ